MAFEPTFNIVLDPIAMFLCPPSYDFGAQTSPLLHQKLILIQKGKFVASARRSLGEVWSRLSDSNRPPTVYKTVALPDELSRQTSLILT